MRLSYFLSVLFAFIGSSTLFGQLVVTPGVDALTPEEYVQQVLLGDGVQAFNVTFNGNPGNTVTLQCSDFSDGDNSNLGINTGVILSTGYAERAIGPNNDDAIGGFLDVIPNQVDGDEDLTILSGEEVNSVAVLEFDFIPLGDTLRFNYVFASDEYPEFVNSFNDAFGFFLAGPGIDGPFTSPPGFPDGAANIALIPGTTTPVTIDNVNNGNDGINGPCVNCEFYVHNGDGFEEPFASDDFYIQYDGFTTVLEAFSLVECGELYHIKLAIGDAIDDAYDSAVFLEEGSFQAPPSGLSIETFFPLGLVEISDVCDSGFATIARPCAADTAWYDLNFLSGDTLATVDEDFTISDTLIILPIGVQDSTFAITTIPDGIDEGNEWLCIEVQESLNGVDFVVLDTVCIQIIDQYTFDVSVDDSQLFCPENLPSFFATPQFPSVGAYDYFWSLNGVDTLGTEAIFIGEQPPNFGDTLEYTLVVRDFCGAFNNPTNPLAINSIPGPTEVTLDEVQQYCPGTPFFPSFLQERGTAPFTYTFQVNDNAPTTTNTPEFDLAPELQNLFNFGDSTAWVKVTVTDNCTPARADTDSILVSFPDPIEVNVTLQPLVCEDQVLELDYTITGGYPPYDLNWQVNPGGPIIIFDTLNNAYSAGNFVDYNVDDPEMDSDYIFTLTANDFCSVASILVQPGLDADTVEAKDCFIPNVISANGDNLNDSFIVYEMINRPGTLSIFNRWGNVLYEGNRNIWTPNQEPEGTYFYVVQFEDGGQDKGSFTIIR